MVFLASYLIALYNKEEYIAECIESIIYEKSKNLEIEVLIVDDGSTDKSLKIALNYSKKYDFVKVFSFKENKGKVSAFNLAFKKSLGSYIFLLGADDVLIKNRTSNMINFMNYSSLSVYGGWRGFKKNYGDLNLNYLPSIVSIKDSIMHNYIPGGTIGLMRRHAEIVFPIPEKLNFEDWWIATILISKELLKPYYEYVQHYRLTGQNDSFSLVKDVKQIEKDIKRTGDYLDLLEKKINNKKYKYFFERSKALRKSFFSRKIKYLKYIFPLDKNSFRLIGYIFLGPKLFHKFNKFLKFKIMRFLL